MQITNGVVRIEDGLRKNEEYAPPRKVSVELSFAIEEGNDPAIVLSNVSEMVRGEVARLLGKVTHTLQVKDTSAPVTEPNKPAGKKGAGKTTEPKPAEKTKADLEAEMGLTTGGPIETSKPAPAEDELGDMLSEPAQAPVTDKEISDACIAKADHMKTVVNWEPKKIRLLVEEFVGHTGAKFKDVPADKRHEFLKRLEALK